MTTRGWTGVASGTCGTDVVRGEWHRPGALCQRARPGSWVGAGRAAALERVLGAGTWVRAYFGQAASILSVTSAVLAPVIQLVACFQKASEPIAAGIWSEPSKRKTAFGSCRVL